MCCLFLISKKGIPQNKIELITNWIDIKTYTKSSNSNYYREIYGLKNMGTLFGISSMSHQIRGAGAVIFFGWSFTKWGTYDYAFLLGVITLLFAGFVSLSLPEKSKSIRLFG